MLASTADLAKPAQMAPLERLLGVPDLAERTLSLLLTPAELALLACSSHALQAAVDALPEPVWQVPEDTLCQPAAVSLRCPQDFALQAAARRQYPAHHPVLHTSSVRSWLCRQHAAHTTLCTGEPTTQTLNPEGIISPDEFTAHALVGHDGQLRVWTIGSSKPTQRWPLPDVPAALLAEPTWACAVQSSSCCLVVRYGGAWLRPRLPGGSTDRSVAGLVFACVSSGECCVVQLPSQTALVQRRGLQLHVCPGKGHVLVHHDAGRQQALSVYTCQGALVNSVHFRAQADEGLQCFWPPSGAAVAVIEGRHATAYLWLLSSHVVSQLHLAYHWAAWATPASDSLLLFNPATTARVKLCGALSAQPELPAFEHALFAVWGRRLAVMTSNPGLPDCSDQRKLHIYAVYGGQHRLEHTVYDREGHARFLKVLQLSADGELCATVSEDSRFYLAIVHLASGVMHEFQLDAMALPGRAHEIAWQISFSRDCTAVLVSDRRSHRSQVLKFSTDASAPSFA